MGGDGVTGYVLAVGQASFARFGRTGQDLGNLPEAEEATPNGDKGGMGEWHAHMAPIASGPRQRDQMRA